MRYFLLSLIIITFTGCASSKGFSVLGLLNPVSWFSDSDRHENINYAPATEGGSSFIKINKKKEIIEVGLKQPENAKDEASLKVTIYPDKSNDNFVVKPIEIDPESENKTINKFDFNDIAKIEIESRIGASMALEFNEVTYGGFTIFTYIGAIVVIIGIALTVLSFWIFKGVMPIWLGPLVIGIGALTAYLSEAIPEYGPYVLGLLIFAGGGYLIHHHALRKDHPSKKESDA